MSGALKHLWPVAVAIVVLGAVGWWVFRTYFDTYHLATIDEGKVYRDGVRSIGQFDIAARKTRVKTIVSLVDDQEMGKSPFPEELAYCQSHNIELIRVPVGLGGWPSGDQVQRFLAIATDPAKQPVMVHCAQGVRRTGFMAAAYQMSVLKYDKEKATAALLTFGHSERTVGDVKRFIEVYDPVTEKMTRDFPQSGE